MALEPETVVMNGFDYGCVRKISWTGAMRDNNAGWQAFVLLVLGFLCDVCYTHLGPIGNNGTHAKLLTDKVFRQARFQELSYAISRLTNIHVAKIAQSRLVDVIGDLPDEAGADWFEDNWTGRQKGRWCKAHAGPGGHNDNQCTESMFSVLQDATFTRCKTTREPQDFNCIVIPSQGYMSLLNPKRNKTAVQLFDEMAKDQELFIKVQVVCSNREIAKWCELQRHPGA